MSARSMLLLLGVLAILSQGNGEVSENRRLLGFDRKVVCRAFSSLGLTVTEGKCTGDTTANCQAVINGLEETTRRFKKWWNEGMCDASKLKHVAESSAKLVVRVWLEATSRVRCEGQGFGCGYSISNGDSFITGVGLALARAAEEGGGDGVGFCADDLRRLGSTKAVVIDDARAEVCTSGGEKSAFEAKFIEMLQDSIHHSYREATANVCDWGDDTKSSCPEDIKLKHQSKAATVDAAISEEVSESVPETAPAEVVEKQPAKETPESAASEKVIQEETAESDGFVEETAGSEEVPEGGTDAAEITDAFDNPFLDEIIIGADPVPVPPVVSDGGDEVVEEKVDNPSCTCAEDLCKGATCNAFPFAVCSTVPNNNDCSDCSAKFYVDDKRVTCGIDLCKPKGSLCANKSLAQCCGVCCRCGSFFSKLKNARKEGLELGFCQEGPSCDCLSGVRG